MNSSKSWDLQINPSVFKILKKIPRPDAENLLIAIRLLPGNPYFGDIQKMTGKAVWRRRIGSYRIFYSVNIDLHSLRIFEITRRTSKTY